MRGRRSGISLATRPPGGVQRPTTIPAAPTEGVARRSRANAVGVDMMRGFRRTTVAPIFSSTSVRNMLYRARSVWPRPSALAGGGQWALSATSAGPEETICAWYNWLCQQSCDVCAPRNPSTSVCAKRSTPKGGATAIGLDQSDACAVALTLALRLCAPSQCRHGCANNAEPLARPPTRRFQTIGLSRSVRCYVLCKEQRATLRASKACALHCYIWRLR